MFQSIEALKERDKNLIMNFMNLKQSPKFWQHRNLWAWLLFPISLLYLCGAKFHKLLYQLHLKKTYFFDVPVIVVGNITVGGTGKTPLVIKLANLLVERGYRPGIVSRGYRGSNQVPLVVNADSDVAVVGDEALVMARNTACPLVICPKRVAAVQKLLHDFNCNVVISDDGLQHYALGRSLEIAVLDGTNRYGNGFCLPAGPLRESISRLKKVDCIVVNSGEAHTNEYAMQIIADKFCRIDHAAKKEISEFAGQTVHAVAAIGNPSRFFNFLRRLKLNLIEHPFPDHYVFKSEDLDFADNLPVIMTEKDAVKCVNFARANFWYLRIDLELSNQLLSSILLKLQR